MHRVNNLLCKMKMKMKMKIDQIKLETDRQRQTQTRMPRSQEELGKQEELGVEEWRGLRIRRRGGWINPEAEDVASSIAEQRGRSRSKSKTNSNSNTNSHNSEREKTEKTEPNKDMSEDPRFTKYFRLLKSGTRTSVEILLKSKFPEVDISILDGWQKKKLFKPAPKPAKVRTRRSPRKRTKQSALRTYLRQKDDLQNLDKGVANAHNLLEEERLTAVVTLVVRYIFVLLKATRSKTKNVFQQFDTSGDGELSLDEFSAGLVALGFVLKPEDREAFRTVDEDDSGNVTMPEFMEMIDRPIENVKLNIVEFRDALRRLEVVVDQDHISSNVR